jgi:hypothetical protein
MSPVFQNVAPGDLITAQNFNLVLNEVNWLVDTVTQLRERIEAVEQHLGSPPAKTGKDTKDIKEGKEGKDKSEAKEIKDATKETKDVKEGKEGKDKSEIKETKETVLEKIRDKSSDVKIVEEKTADKVRSEKVTLEKSRLEGISHEPLAKAVELDLDAAQRGSELAQAAAGDPTGYGVPVTAADSLAAGDVAGLDVARAGGIASCDGGATPNGSGIQHFITSDLRPDLSTSALDDEPDIATSALDGKHGHPAAGSSAVAGAPAHGAHTSPDGS